MQKKRGVERGVESQDIILSKEQQEILLMITEDFLTPKQISIRRETNISAVYKTIKKLKEKGVLRWGGRKGVENFRTTPHPHLKQPKHSDKSKSFDRYIRLHAQEFNIEILYKTEQYEYFRQKSNIITIDNNTIRLYKTSIEVYSGKDFNAEDEVRATALSMQYWTKFFFKLEDYLKIILIKPRSNNIKIVNNHYAEVNNEIAKEYNRKKIKLHIYTKDDGKLWFTIDNSFNLNEAETQHPETAKNDMGKVKDFFNDIREKKSLLPSETTQSISILSDTFSKFMQEQAHYAENLRTHVEAIKKLSEGVEKMMHVIERFEKNVKKGSDTKCTLQE